MTNDGSSSSTTGHGDVADTKHLRGAEWRAGWPVVAAAALGYGSGAPLLLVTAGLFVSPMRAEFGWSAKAVVIAPINLLMVSLVSPFAGALLDRGSRRIAAMSGLVLVALGLIMLSYISPSRPAQTAIAVAIGVVAPLCGAITFTRGVATWFRDSPGTAFGATLSGSSVVALVVVPTVTVIVDRYGWRSGYRSLAGLILLCGLLPVLISFREHAKDRSPVLAAEPREGVPFGTAIRDSRFWMLVAGLTIAAAPLGSFLTNLQALLASKHFGVGAVAAIGAAYSAGIGFGRICGGALLDRLPPYSVPAGLFGLASAGAFTLGTVSPDQALVVPMFAAGLIGLGNSAEADFLAFFIVRLFGMRAFSRLSGIGILAVGLGMAAGGLGFAVIFDAYGSYSVGCRVAGWCFLAAAGVIALAYVLGKSRNAGRLGRH